MFRRAWAPWTPFSPEHDAQSRVEAEARQPVAPKPHDAGARLLVHFGPATCSGREFEHLYRLRPEWLPATVNIRVRQSSLQYGSSTPSQHCCRP